ncbi:MAG: glycosyltransferase family 4 protein [Bacteroidota bacterium]
MKRQIERVNILAVHLLNNFSGSPKVFANALLALNEVGAEIELITSNGPGFLDGLKLTYHHLSYKWHANRWLRLWNFFIAQWQIFWKVIFLSRRIDIVYINTLLPGSAALAAKLMGKKVIYHMHETHVGDPALDSILKFMFRFSADKAVFVSQYLKGQYEKVSHIDRVVVSNSIPLPEEKNNAQGVSKTYDVLMISSLKKEKGLFEFIQLASILQHHSFLLIIGSTQEAIDTLLGQIGIPHNLTILPAQSNVHSFYRKSKVLLNLSHPYLLPESFGMTVLEGLSHGLPCIVPPVGGPSEIIEHGVEGYHFPSTNLSGIGKQIDKLLGDEALYEKQSRAAVEKSACYSHINFNKNICNQILFFDYKIYRQ